LNPDATDAAPMDLSWRDIRMNTATIDSIFSRETLDQLFPPNRADEFFEALFGDPSEGAYDIKLGFKGYGRKENELEFELELHQRPGRCLACNLTYGLPQVFSRHPVIDIQGVVSRVGEILGREVASWELGSTRQYSSALHAVPLLVRLAG